MATKSNNTALWIGAAAVGAYLIFKRNTPPPGIAQPLQPSPATTAGNLLAQTGNLLKTLFGDAPGNPISTDEGTFSDPAGIAVARNLPAPVPSVKAPAPSSGMVLQLNGVYNNHDGKHTSDFIGMDAAAIDHESIGYTDYDWAGKDKGVFDGRNGGMNPFHEINGTALATLGACLACLPASRKIGKIDWEKYIIPVGVVVGGYVLLKSTNLFSGIKTGIQANNEASAAANKAALDASIANAKASGDIQTITDAELSSLANDIMVQAFLSTPNLDQIQRDIIQVNTLTDLLKLAQAFGMREANTGSWYSICAFTGLNCTALDLASFVRLALDQSHLSAVNGYLTAQRINFQF